MTDRLVPKTCNLCEAMCGLQIEVEERLSGLGVTYPEIEVSRVDRLIDEDKPEEAIEIAERHHLHKPVVIGEVNEEGQFDIVWQTDGPIRAEAWSPFIPDSAKKVADWTYPWVCGNCTEPKF